MARISIPMMNKVGYSMFWNSMWDDRHNYTRNLKEDIFFKKFIHLLFNDGYSTKFIFYSNIFNQREKNNFKYKIIFKNFLTNTDLMNYFFKKNKFSFFFSKIWILRYQTWIIIYFFIFLKKFIKLKIFKKKIKQKKKKLNFLFLNYFLNACKFNYLFKYFKENKKKSFVF